MQHPGNSRSGVVSDNPRKVVWRDNPNYRAGRQAQNRKLSREWTLISQQNGKPQCLFQPQMGQTEALKD